MTTTAFDDQYKFDYIARSYVLDKIAMELESFPREARLGANISEAGWIWRDDGGNTMLASLCGESKITHDQWLQCREELINCPTDSEAPEWAEWKAQDEDGAWCWYKKMPDRRSEGFYAEHEEFKLATHGKIPSGHRWQDTLTRINRIETSTPEEEEEFVRIQGRQDAERPHEADARQLDEQLEAYMGRKRDAEKPRFDLLIKDMPLALEAVARVLTFGASKYADGNWQYVENADNRYLAASMRHELALSNGHENDDETGEHHIAHKLCCDLFRLELALRNR